MGMTEVEALDKACPLCGIGICILLGSGVNLTPPTGHKMGNCLASECAMWVGGKVLVKPTPPEREYLECRGHCGLVGPR